MNSNPPEEIEQAYVGTVEPALTQLRGRFGNFAFAKKKVKNFSPITNENILQEIKELSDSFPFLPDNV